jgi:hypothetical protein
VKRIKEYDDSEDEETKAVPFARQILKAVKKNYFDGWL